MAYFGKRRIAKVNVVTQGRNVRAQRLYQKSGFATDSVMLWYHKWFRNSQLVSSEEAE
jgi:ribosomal protein S18 acetylase RimI-like enzyme